jgi:precorrin-8X/cobalt-precorrin-8 methylmutase
MMARRFDHYVIVDWSAASQKKKGSDSIWICHRGPGGERCENPATRHLAKLYLVDILAGAAVSGERVLLGFDFPFGYPAGFAAGLGLSGPPWRAVWDEISRLVEDDPNNRNNRFEVAISLNKRISNGPFPFWGCPVGKSDPFFKPKFHRAHGGATLAERRLIDCWMIGAQPCWKLAYTGSVGSQSLTGIPVVRELRDDARWADRAKVWPFETGLALPEDARIVFAEVWPSWWTVPPQFRLPGDPKDKAQVRTVVETFARCDQTGELTAWFKGDPELGDEQRRIVETEEAWTLGVTAPRRRPIALNSETSSSTLIAPLRSRGRRGKGEVGDGLFPGVKPGTGSLPTEGRMGADGVGTGGALAEGKGEGPLQTYAYLNDPAAISRRSLALVRAEADLSRFSGPLRRIAARIAHAVGDVTILDDLVWSKNAVKAGAMALRAGVPILVDAAMVAAGINRERLTAANAVLCFLHDPAVPTMVSAQRTTRSAAAVELWRPYLGGAVVAIGNAPTALFRLLEIIAEGETKPAVILGFPVGFVGAAEAKAALAACGHGLEFITLYGRRGGSSIAAAAVNALADRR